MHQITPSTKQVQIHGRSEVQILRPRGFGQVSDIFMGCHGTDARFSFKESIFFDKKTGNSLSGWLAAGKIEMRKYYVFWPNWTCFPYFRDLRSAWCAHEKKRSQSIVDHIHVNWASFIIKHTRTLFRRNRILSTTMTPLASNLDPYNRVGSCFSAQIVMGKAEGSFLGQSAIWPLSLHRCLTLLTSLSESMTSYTRECWLC